jgi:hypothetical protein
MNSRQRISALRRLGHQLLKDWTRNDDIDTHEAGRRGGDRSVLAGGITIHAAGLVNRDAPVVLDRDYNVMPTDIDVYKPERWVDDALFRPEVRAAYHQLLEQGWTDALRKLHPGERIYTFWDYFRNAYGRDAALRICRLEPLRIVGSNGPYQVFGSGNHGAAASARQLQGKVPADSGSRPTVFNGSSAK